MDDDFETLDSVFAAKKKKKKKVIELDVTGVTSAAFQEEKPKDDEIIFEESAPTPIDDVIDLENFGKKKKKKKVTINLDDIDDGKDKDEKDNGDLSGKKESATHISADFDLDIDFSTTKKKKKSKKKNLEDLVGAFETDDPDQIEFEVPRSSWTDSDRDYTYDELLTRVFDIIYEKNPDAAFGRKQKFVMRPPQVLRVGTKKTSFANFLDIARTLHRVPKHLMDFVLSELGTSGSMDGYQQLVIKGRFQSKQIENVLRRYVKEYVTCHTCRSPNTTLQKDTRLYFLQCESCGSRCSVASIKSGFQAIISKRAKMRGRNSN